MLSHLSALIVGEGKTPLRADSVEDGAKAGEGGRRAGIVHLGQSNEQRSSFDQSADGRSIARTFDQVALPVTGNDALVDFRGAQMDAGHVGCWE